MYCPNSVKKIKIVFVTTLFFQVFPYLFKKIHRIPGSVRLLGLQTEFFLKKQQHYVSRDLSASIVLAYDQKKSSKAESPTRMIFILNMF